MVRFVCSAPCVHSAVVAAIAADAGAAEVAAVAAPVALLLQPFAPAAAVAIAVAANAAVASAAVVTCLTQGVCHWLTQPLVGLSCKGAPESLGHAFPWS